MFRGLHLATLLLLPVLGGAAAPEEKVEIVPGLQVTVAVPEKWTSARSAEGGYPSLLLRSEANALTLQVSFFPDANGLMADEEMQLVMLGELVGPYIADSVEKGAQMKPLSPRRGSGLYCVFTDAKLVGLTELPPNEYRHATTSLKIGNGWFAVFTLLSQDTTSSDYRAALGVLKDSLHGATTAPKPRRDPNAF